MKIGFEAISIFGSSGIEMYSRSLIDALVRSSLNVDTYLFTSASRYERVKNFFPESEKLFIKKQFTHPLVLGEIGAPLIKIIKNRILMKKVSKQVDLFHNVNPCYYNKFVENTAVTVHDLFVFSEDEWAKKAFNKEQLEFRENFILAFENAKVIFTDTEHVKQNILQDFPTVKEERIFVTHLATSKIFNSIPADTKKLDSYGLKPEDKFFLFVSRFDPRKNYFSIVTAYSILPENIKKKYKLVFAGGAKEKIVSELNEFVRKTGVSINYLHLDNIPVKELVALYQRATALVFPSFAEGFGLPVVEAMNCGCPVITSNVSCLPEIGGDAVHYVNPYDVKDIMLGMMKVADDENYRNQLIQFGLERGKKFSWENTALETLKGYEYGIKQL